jgi:DNA-binding NarL/FixJ family response regulator
MLTPNILLLSNKGKVADAIIDLLPEHFHVRQPEFTGYKLLKAIQLENDRFPHANVIILNLSEISSESELLLSNLNSTYNDVPVIVLHLYHQKIFADAFLKMGAKAYLSINFHTEDLLSAIESVISKKTFIANSSS